MSERNFEVFREEALELLEELEHVLLELEERPTEEDLIDETFRHLHTLKGSGAMFGCTDLAALAHEFETVFEAVRDGDAKVTVQLVNLSLAARDCLKQMVLNEGKDSNPVQSAQIVQSLHELIQVVGTSAKDSGTSSLPADQDAAAATWHIRFRPPRDLFQRGLNPMALLQEFNRLGSCRIIAQLDDIPSLEDLDSTLCYLRWDIIVTTEANENTLRDVFVFVEDDSEIDIELIDNRGLIEDDDDRTLLIELLLERADVSAEGLRDALRERKRLSATLAGNGAETTAGSATAGSQSLRQTASASKSIRISSERLDSLVDLVGELVTVQARLSQYAQQHDDSSIDEISEAVERLTWDLRDQVLDIRMVPVGSTFASFRRLVRDLADDLDKDIELVTEGAKTELDKTVIDRLGEPLIHLIRNSVDHGIEAPDVRETLGKARRGRISLVATHSGANVLLRVADDGAGFNKEAIRAKAIERELIKPGAELSDKELYQVIFEPGFSTAEHVSNVSGRGVGMDVVAKAITGLRGSIDVDSTAGEGTAFTIKLPLTLAIIDGLLVQIGDDNFVLPLAAVEECIELKRANRTHDRNVVSVRDEFIPFVSLRDEFDLGAEVPEIEQVVVVNLDGSRIGFVVDHVVGEHQTVIKNLGRMYRQVDGLSGATILGDGRVALILDLPQLAERARSQENRVVDTLKEDLK